MKNYILLIFLFGSLTGKLYSQTTPPAPIPNGFVNALMVSDTKEPSVARFQEYSFVPVDLYSGKAKIDIPFYQLNIDGLKIPISLEYNTQGIQVNSVASRVGTGWVLNAGGNIGRSIKEVNDFHFVARYFNGSGGTGGMPLDCAGTLGHPLRVGWKYRNSNVCVSTLPMPVPGPNNIDISPDIFTVAAPGLQSQFYYPDSEMAVAPNVDQPETTSPKEIEPIGASYSSRIKDFTVTYPNAPNFPSFFQDIPLDKRRVRDYFNFGITNNGFKYSFNDYDLSYLNSPNSYYAQPPFGGVDHQELNWDVSAWHLNTIENINTGKKVEFIYESVPFYTTSKLLYKYFLDQPEYGNYIKPPQYNDVMETNVYLAPKRLKTIVSDEVTIKFQYDHSRKDLVGDYALTGVQIFNTQNKLIKEYKLYYSYMKDAAADGFDKRLYLDYVEELGQDNGGVINKYVLNYIKGDLPGSNSISQSDWYGYFKRNFNANGTERPILYMNTGLKNFSILPIQLQGTEIYPLRGNRSIYPDVDDMTVGMLNKITYPTGGYTSLKYEANRFRIKNQEVLGGGLRIASQEISDLNATRKLFYTYQEPDGLTSGYVNNVPSYGFLTSELQEGYNGSGGFNDMSQQEKQNFIGGTFLTMVRSLVSVDKTQNTFVGYSNVKEEEQGNGYTIYRYTSPKEYPNIPPVFNPGSGVTVSFFLNNTSYPNLDVQTNLNVRTGKLTSKEVYNVTNELLRKETYQYSYKIFNETVAKRGRNIPFATASGGYPIRFDMTVKLLSHRDMLSERRSLDYVTGGTVENVQSFEYDPDLPLIKVQTTGSGQDIMTQKLYYPKDMLSLGNQTTEMQQLINQKRNAEIIKTEYFKNNLKLSEKQVKYGITAETGGKLRPVASYESMNSINIGSDEDKVMSIDLYDEKGNVLQTTDKSKTPTVTVWGYNKTLPIAKVTGAQYNQISGSISDIVNKSNVDIDGSSEKEFIKSLDLFSQNLPSDFFTTTYTHDPLIGITSKSDQSGIRKYYIYDFAGRLQNTKNSEGKTLEIFKYNNAERYYNTIRSSTFTRSNCQPGYQGGTYTYTVPNGTYTSSISQVDADGKAQAEINTNGQMTADMIASCEPKECFIQKDSSAFIMGAVKTTSPGVGKATIIFNHTGGVTNAQVIGGCVSPATTQQLDQGNWRITVFPGGGLSIRTRPFVTVPNGYVTENFLLPVN